MKLGKMKTHQLHSIIWSNEIPGSNEHQISEVLKSCFQYGYVQRISNISIPETYQLWTLVENCTLSLEKQTKGMMTRLQYNKQIQSEIIIDKNQP